MAINRSQNRTVLKPPPVLCLYDPRFREQTTHFLESIFQYCARQERLLHLDFSEVVNLSAAACLVLFANISSSLILTGYRHAITLTLPRPPKARAQLLGSGLARAIKQASEEDLESLWENIASDAAADHSSPLPLRAVASFPTRAGAIATGYRPRS